MNTELYTKAEESAAFIRGKMTLKPRTALVLGSGLGGLADRLEDAEAIPYGDIPHFSRSTAPGHKGRLVIGKLGGAPVLCMQGRFHYYEGYSTAQVTFPVRVMKLLGVKTLILTNAAGGLDPAFAAGDLLLITDHINYTGTNPLIGPNEDGFGPRFPDMTAVYTPALRQLAKKAAADLGITLREGVYLGCTGPSFETPAEIRFFQMIGAAAVGMSTVNEAIVARHSGLDVLAISCITNLGAGILDQPLTSEEVFAAADMAAGRFQSLLTEIVRTC